MATASAQSPCDYLRWAPVRRKEVITIGSKTIGTLQVDYDEDGIYGKVKKFNPNTGKFDDFGYPRFDDIDEWVRYVCGPQFAMQHGFGGQSALAARAAVAARNSVRPPR